MRSRMIYLIVAMATLTYLLYSSASEGREYEFVLSLPKEILGLRFPTGVAVDDSGNVYVADTFNHRIQKFRPVVMPAVEPGGDEADNPVSEDCQDCIPAELDSQFQLEIHQTASIELENIKVTFLDVTGDSRCPSDVTCIWAGEVKILVNIFKNDQDLGGLTLILQGEGYKPAIETFDGYSIRLLKVDPYPVSTQKIELSDYIITLVVTEIPPTGIEPQGKHLITWGKVKG